MLTIWIIHRDQHHRAALARIAGAGDSAVLGGPDERLFESASPPGVVVLGLSDDFEQELEFVHRFGPKLRGSAWVLLASKADLPEARRLFDTLSASFLTHPPEPLALRRALRSALGRRSVDSLSSRQGRDTLRDRFARWFADIDLPELMRAIDPRLSGVPVLVRGEDGTGRTLLARYVHAFGGSGEQSFIHVACRGIASAAELRAQIEAGGQGMVGDAFTILLEDVDHLAIGVQRRVQDWIEFGLPDGTLRGSGLRWIGAAGDDGDLDADPGLEPRLAESLSGLTIRIPSLRERPDAVAAFVADTARAWSSAHGQRPRRFSPDALTLLDAYPWPGNLHELEAVVIQTLSFTSADPLLPVQLRFPGDSHWLEQSFAPAPTRFVADPTPAEMAPREPEPAASQRESVEDTIPEATYLDDEEDDWEDDLEEVIVPLTVEDEVEEEALAATLIPLDDASADLHPLTPMDADSTEDGLDHRDASPRAASPATADAIRVPDAAGIANVLPVSDAAEVAAFTPGPSAVDLATAAAEAVLPHAAKPAASHDDETDLRRLVRAVAHEVRNPLVSIRTFSELLPDHYDDADFRGHFRELVSQDVLRIDEAVTRLQSMVELPELKTEPVDVAHLLESLLDERRDEIQARRLLVLKELDHSVPHALGDPLLLRDAFNGLIKRALDRVTDRGDIYVASKHHATGLAGGPSLRVLLRYTAGLPGEESTAKPEAPHSENLDGVMAQTIVHSLGGQYTEDATDAEECVVVIDLPAPS
jgi:DNA-binding NtrC family response regulator